VEQKAEERAGRIGRIVMRNAIEHGDIEVVAVNE
jgi:glyceraldehyde-3-phosphate dehydrogenase/erythrose-4-phosphate dehydrogenase